MSYEINHRRKTQKILKRRERGGGGVHGFQDFIGRKIENKKKATKATHTVIKLTFIYQINGLNQYY